MEASNEIPDEVLRDLWLARFGYEWVSAADVAKSAKPLWDLFWRMPEGMFDEHRLFNSNVVRLQRKE